MVWTRPYIFFTAKVPGITASTRFQDANGDQFVFGVDISLKAISDFLASLEIGRTGRAVIIDQEGFLIAASDIGRLLNAQGGQPPSARIDEIDDAELTAAYDRYRVEGYGRRVLEVHGRRIVSIVAQLPTAERTWNMVIVVPEKDFTGFVTANSRVTLFMSLGVIAVVAALAILLVWEEIRTDRVARLLRQRGHVVGRQHAALGFLATNSDLFDPTQRAPPPMLTEMLLDTTSARRASLWRLTEGAQTLRCEDSCDRDSGRHVAGNELSRQEVPRFFAHLATGEELEVANAAEDPRTAQVYRVMMEPSGSRSLFVAPVRHAGQVTGALWIEDLPAGDDMRDFLRIVANLMAIRMTAVPAAVERPKAAVAVSAAVLPAERSFSAELAVRGIDIEGLAAETYPKVAVMVLRMGDPVAIATRQPDSPPMLADAIACALQQIAIEHDIPYLRATGQEIVAAAGWDAADATAAARIADAALAVRDTCLHLFDEAGQSPSFRVGLDLGLAIGGAVGREPRLFNLWGEAVVAADMMARSALPGAIQTTEAVHRSLARDFLFRPRGDFYLPRVGSARTFILVSRL